MNSINIMFSQPWLLLLIIPAVLLALRPFLVLPVKYRYMKKRLVSLGLHIVTSILVILVLSGISIDLTSVESRSDIMIVVDASASNLPNKEKVQELIQEILDEAPADYQVGIIAFAKDNVYQVKMDTNKDKVYQNYINETYSLDASATNLSDALHTANEQLNNPNNGRIVVISDGRETDGNAYVTAKDIAETGVRIDAYYVTPQPNLEDTLVEGVTYSDNIRVGVPFEVTVALNSSYSTLGTLSVEYRNVSGELLNTEDIEVQVQEGQTDIIFEATLENAGVTEVIVTLDTQNEELIEENNIQYSFVNITGDVENSVLIIEGVDSDADKVLEILNDYEYDTTVKSVKDLNITLDEVLQYSAVVLVNITNEDLVSNSAHTVLDSYVRDYGGGLLTIGGDRSYQKEDMLGEGVDTTFSNLLPIESSTDPKAMAVVIVMDASSSMTTNGSTKLDLAKAAAVASLETLAAQSGDVTHQFGVVTFDANVKDVIQMTSVEEIESLTAQINLIESGYGTRYTGGLQEARTMLDDPSLVNAEKHIIFLTDGESQDSESQYFAVLNSLENISVSTIALGAYGEPNLDAETVESMVVEYNDRGNYYRVTDDGDLYDIMTTEMEAASSSDFKIEEPFYGVINNILPELSSVSNLPSLDGYYVTRAKPEANVVMQTNTGDPLFAVWYPGLNTGKVASFMSDLRGDSTSLSESFLQDFVGIAFTDGIVSSIIPKNPVNVAETSVGYIDLNNSKEVRVRLDLQAGDSVQAYATNPLGESTRVGLTEMTATTFSGSFETLEPGLYQLDVVHYDQYGTILSTTQSYSSFSYSKEYTHEYDEELTISLMESISDNGSYLTTLSNMFSVESETITTHVDVMTILAILSMILFLVDIIIRKFKFKWSHEYFKKSRYELKN